jgi:hypothetical protein
MRKLARLKRNVKWQRVIFNGVGPGQRLPEPLGSQTRASHGTYQEL